MLTLLLSLEERKKNSPRQRRISKKKKKKIAAPSTPTSSAPRATARSSTAARRWPRTWPRPGRRWPGSRPRRRGDRERREREKRVFFLSRRGRVFFCSFGVGEGRAERELLLRSSLSLSFLFRCYCSRPEIIKMIIRNKRSIAKRQLFLGVTRETEMILLFSHVRVS